MLPRSQLNRKRRSMTQRRRSMQSIFSVYPENYEVKAMASKEFEVSFRPQHANTFEGGMLECLVYHKVNRTFRLVDLKRFTPPWLLTVRGMGHTMGNLRND